MKKILFTFLILTSCYAIGADVDNALLQKNLEAANTQIEVLKAQVEVMKSYQDNFLTTVYWSLGGVFGIVVLLVGYNWFSNFKNQEKEIQYFKDLISSTLETSKKELSGELILSKNEMLKNIMSEIDLKIDSSVVTLRNDIKRDINELNIKLRNVSRNHDLLSMDVLEFEYDKWVLKEYYMMRTRTAAQLVKKACELQSDGAINRYLGLLVESLKATKTVKRALGVDDISLVTKCLKNIGEEHESTLKLINKLLHEITDEK